MLSCWSDVPPIEASSDQEQAVLHTTSDQLDIYSQTEGHLDIYSPDIPSWDVPPSRGF